ncbi:MAG: TetR/AcrR family transcriptional regulator [Bacteroidia bacterium]
MPVQKITREEIIEKSMEIFLLKGYHDTSMDDLAKTCNLQKGSFYHYYKSKEELMKAVLIKGLEIAKSEVFACAYLSELPAGKRLKMMFVKQKEMFLIYKTGCLFGNTLLETVFTVPQFKEILNLFFNEWEKAFINIYTSKYSKSAAKSAAITAISQIEGVLMLAMLRNNYKLLDQAYQTIYDEFMRDVHN